MTATGSMKLSQAVARLPQATAMDGVSHNLNGQRLGRKGRGTRERILAACAELLADPDEPSLSMSGVARRASLGMTSLYNYFADLTELLLAVLEPVMATAEESYLALLREPWPDAELAERCHAFMRAYHGFWSQHSRLLHLRNAMADAGDRRLLLQRIHSARPLIALLCVQMGGREDEDIGSPRLAMATVLATGIERTVTVATDAGLTGLFGPEQRRPEDFYLQPGARLIELAIRDTRAG